MITLVRKITPRISFLPLIIIESKQPKFDQLPYDYSKSSWSKLLHLKRKYPKELTGKDP